MGFLTKLFGSYSDRELKRITPIADAIEALEPRYQAMGDEELRAQTALFKPPGRRWTTSCPRPTPPCGRPPGACWG